ncbi:hypothetical protein [Tautonia plasticadhaerens]|uniref:Uncharacterized protein n=1 Tax=Tautonia plasticadhaerens TaxID=2527974 RepID=A0A518GWA0_9BACT|nr:hypothetical protein [Tautonia plasticadhaerens]QDV32876.1 hypothetical protein ElP_07160 [Tautonia plasticadhaerens]
MAKIRRVSGLRVRLGGLARSGWPPPGAATPPPPTRDVMRDLRIEPDGPGVLPIAEARDGSTCSDSRDETPGDAERAASAWFGVGPEAWGDG